MATYYSNTSNRFRLRLEVTQVSQNVENNTSSVRSRLILEAGWEMSWTSTRWLDVDGSRVYSVVSTTLNTPVNGGEVLLYDNTATITHNADGTKSIALGAYFDVTGGRAYYTPDGPLNLSASMTLTTIPRATTPSASAGTLGSAHTISMPYASSTFRHDVTYKFYSTTGTIGTGLTNSVSWTPPLSLASEIPSATSGTMTITVVTKSGSTVIGSKSINVSMSVPSSVVPTISAVTLTEAVAGLVTQFGAFVRHKSKVRIQTTSTGVYGSKIQTVSVGIDGKTYSGADVTSSEISAVGSFPSGVAVTVTDSRGRTASTTRAITIVDWYTPKVTSFSARRATGTTIDDQGSNAVVSYGFDIAPVGNKNTRLVKLEYLNGSTWTEITRWTTLYSANTTYNTGALFNPDNSYLLRLTVQDYFGSVSSQFRLGTAFTTIDIHSSGRGIAFGKVSEKQAMEVALPAEFEKGIAFLDTRSVPTTPEGLPARAISFDFKSNSSVGNPPITASTTYSHIINVAGWNSNEGSGGWPTQMSVSGGGIAVRQATSATAWGPWKEVGGLSSVAWGDVSGKPAQATRWPTWSEVTGKPTIPGINHGSWTPTFRGSTTAGTVSYESRSGFYYRIGHMVFIQAYLSINSISSGAGYFQLTGLPYAQDTASRQYWVNSPSSGYGIYYHADVYSNAIWFRNSEGTGAVPWTNISSKFYVNISGWYMASAVNTV